MTNYVPTYAHLGIPCQAPQCDRNATSYTGTATWLCTGHQTQQRRGQPLKPLRTYKRSTGTCDTPGCTHPTTQSSTCNYHRTRTSRGQPPWPTCRRCHQPRTNPTRTRLCTNCQK